MERITPEDVKAQVNAEKAAKQVKEDSSITPVNMRVPAALHKRMKRKALDNDMTLTEAYMEAAEEWLNEV